MVQIAIGIPYGADVGIRTPEYSLKHYTISNFPTTSTVCAFFIFIGLVQMAGVEPARVLPRRILSYTAINPLIHHKQQEKKSLFLSVDFQSKNNILVQCFTYDYSSKSHMTFSTGNIIYIFIKFYT